MDISSQMNVGQSISGNDEGLGLSSFSNTEKQQQGNVQKKFTQQFKQAISQTSDELEQSETRSDISQLKSEGAKEVIQQNYNNLHKMADLNIAQNIDTEIPDDMMKEVLENSSFKKLDKQKKETQELLQKKLIGEKSSTGLRSLLSAANTSLFSKWLKQLSKKKKDIDESEGISTDESIDTQKTEKTQQTKKKTSSANITKQQKLFTLNLKSSIRFLKNMKTLKKRFFPELIIYEEESGYVDGEKTLECLGWQNISTYQQTLFNELTNENLNSIGNVQKIVAQAIEDGLALYRGKHPIFSKEENILAVEKLTGELTVLQDLIELKKLQLEDDVLTCQQVSDR